MIPAIFATLLWFAQFSTTTDLVEVYASVTGPAGVTVEDLRAEDFTVFENGVDQPIQTFARGEAPLSVVLAVDRSFSMSGAPLRLARDAGKAFLHELKPDDSALVVAVGTDIEVMGELSRNRAEQYAALDQLLPWGTTSLHDAIIDVLDRVGEAQGRRAVIVLSDGQDRYSHASAEDVVARVRQSDALIYGVALGKTASPLFDQLADLSGGRAYHVTVPQQFTAVFSSIARDLRTQYLLGYQRPPGSAGWRTIEVHVKRPDVNVRARSGYLAR